MVVVLNLGALVDFKAHAGEHVHNLVLDQRDGMQIAHLPAGAGHGDVHRLRLVAGLQLDAVNLGAELLVAASAQVLHSLMVLPAAGRSFLGTSRRPFIRAGTLPFLPRYFCQKAESSSLPAHSGSVGFQLLLQRADFFFHSTPLTFSVVQTDTLKKRPRPWPKGQWDEAVCNTPRYHPYSAGNTTAALVSAGNGAGPSRVTWHERKLCPPRFARATRSELRRSAVRGIFQPVGPLSAVPRCAASGLLRLLSPSRCFAIDCTLLYACGGHSSRGGGE